MRQADEEAQFDQFGHAWIFSCEEIQRVVYERYGLVIRGRCDSEFFERHPLTASISFQGQFAPGVLDEDSTHRLGSRRKEVPAIFPARIGVFREAQPGFVDERGGLKRVTGGLVRHPRGGEFAQLLVNQWKQFLSSAGIALLNTFKDAGEFAHERFVAAIAEMLKH